MSAFCGVYQLDGKPINKEQLDAITQTLALWEPDKRYQWVEQNLGVSQWQRYHTPEAVYAAFPTVNHHNHYLLASNTRLDNRDELIDQLNINPIDARQLSDEDFILRAYAKWQEDCSKHLLGDFAFVIWDGNKQQLFLSRDQIGHCKTIYYYHLPGKLFVFGSNIRPVYEHPDVPIELNEFSVANYLIHLEPADNQTFYKNIFRLPVGHNLIIQKGKLRLQKYFSWPAGEKIRYKTDQEYIDHFNEIFHQAVKNRLRSNTIMSTHLSGGLDSSSITAIAAKILHEKDQTINAYGAIPPKNHTFHIPKNSIADESPYMDAVALQYPNIKLTKIINNAETSLFTNLSRYHLYAERPCRIPDSHIWLENIFEQCNLNNSHNLLCGYFGDYSISWKGPSDKNYWVYLNRFFHQYLRPIQKTFRKKPLSHLINPEFSQSQGMLWHLLKSPLIKPYDLGYSNKWYKPELAFFCTTWESLFGIEMRNPITDLNIFKFCSNIPAELYRDAQSDRLLIRKAMTHHLPNLVRLRDTKGFQLFDWDKRFNHEYKAYMAHFQSIKTDSTRNNYYNLSNIEQILDSWPHQKITESNRKEHYSNYRQTLMTLVCHNFIKENF